MFKILNFLKSGTGNAKLVTMRQRFDAAQQEMNAVLSDLSEMPVVSVDAQMRRIDITAPEQFADEALALPAPDADDSSEEHDTVELAKAS